jgi:hypothetical protein
MVISQYRYTFSYFTTFGGFITPDYHMSTQKRKSSAKEDAEYRKLSKSADRYISEDNLKDLEEDLLARASKTISDSDNLLDPLDLCIGDDVEARWARGFDPEYPGWYRGKITSILGNGRDSRYTILFDDGFSDDDVLLKDIRRPAPVSRLRPGTFSDSDDDSMSSSSDEGDNGDVSMQLHAPLQLKTVINQFIFL